MPDVVKRPDAWRFQCPRCARVGDWRDRRWMAESDLAGHTVQWHGGTPRVGDGVDG